MKMIKKDKLAWLYKKQNFINALKNMDVEKSSETNKKGNTPNSSEAFPFHYRIWRVSQIVCKMRHCHDTHIHRICSPTVETTPNIASLCACMPSL